MERGHDGFEPFQKLPSYLSQWPPIIDALSTQTSELQNRTIKECLPLLTAVNDPSSNPFDFDEHGLQYLNRKAHARFLNNGLGQLPSQFVAMDASRPWLMYWSLMSMYLMGYDTQKFQNSLIKTFEPLQNKSGGFGGGQGHLSHLACTYSVILALAVVGGDEAYSLIDRPSLYHWLGRLKHASGGFRICEDGEVDVRGAYCTLVAITLLDLPWELPHDSPARSFGFQDFRHGLGTYLSQCQTYEGGISAGPSNEAHGAYAFCAIACLCLLGKPKESLETYLDVESLLRWLSARQYAPEGGFAGRTNKVVDGCYSHWIGGCWPLVEAAISGPSEDPKASPRLFSPEGLCRYILNCCQAPSGGLRDKPSKRPDTYHTCYNLVGLSMASHRQSYLPRQTESPGLLSWAIGRDESFLTAWEDNGADEGDSSVHPAYDPIFIIPHAAAINFQRWSKAQTTNFR